MSSHAHRLTHGHAIHGRESPTYRSWVEMRRRCRCGPGRRAHADYVARGIAVCARWRSFEAFLADMGARPDGLSLDRIDNDRGYEPGNCRWATRSEQSLNQRNRITDDRVRAIRSMRADGAPYSIISMELGVSKGYALKICLRRVRADA